MSEFEQVQLSNSELFVSRFGYGTYHLGDKLDFIGAVESLGAAFDAGINFFDTSDNYQGSEAIIGHALRSGVLPRDDVVITTKTGIATSWYEAVNWASKDTKVDCSPERVRKQVGKSLLSLGVDEIDLYQFHKYDPEIPHAEAAGVMSELLAEGKILSWGVSNYSAEQLTDLLEACKRDGLEIPVSTQPYLNILSGNGSNARVAQESGMAVLAYAPLMKGLLTDPGVAMAESAVEILKDSAVEDQAQFVQQLELDLDDLKAVQQRAGEIGLSLAQLSLALIVDTPSTVVLTAPTKPEYLEDVVVAERAKLEYDPELSALIVKLQGSSLAVHGSDLMRMFKQYYR